MHVLFFPKYTHQLFVFNIYFVGIPQGQTRLNDRKQQYWSQSTVVANWPVSAICCHSLSKFCHSCSSG
jgi:hypothetical protein